MTPITLRRRLLVPILPLAILVAACTADAPQETPPPATLVTFEDLATRDALRSAASASPPAEQPTGVVTTAEPSPEPSPSVTEHAPTKTPLPTASATEAQVAPPSATQSPTATASLSPTSTQALAATATVEVAPPTARPASAIDEPYVIIFYGDAADSDDLYLLTLGGEVRAVTSSPANEREPSCAPDGRTVVYASDASGSFQIYRLDLAGGQPVQLTQSEGMSFAPVFSPDGSQIAYVSTRAGGIPTIWVMNADGSQPRQITDDVGRDTTPAWGPDGRELLFSHEQGGSWDLYLTLLQEGVDVEIPLMPPDVSQGNQVWPAIDGAGERVAYTQWDNLEDPQTADIYLLDYEQPAPVPVRAGAGADIVWGWADDSHLLASVGSAGDIQIALVDSATGDATRLTAFGTFNGGARLCQVATESLGPAPTAAASPPPQPAATPSPEPATSGLPAALVAAAGHKHIIQPGDTLMNIGYQFGVNWQYIADLNQLPNPDRLIVGETLTVPVTRVGRRTAGVQHPDSDQLVSMARRKEIVVELERQLIRAYEDGQLIKTVVVSTGLPATPTVEGEFSIYIKRDSQTMSGPGYYLPGVPWVMYFYQGYGIHGTYWHNNFGQPMSHGCVNLPTPDAQWFYRWAEIGTPVLVRR